MNNYNKLKQELEKVAQEGIYAPDAQMYGVETPAVSSEDIHEIDNLYTVNPDKQFRCRVAGSDEVSIRSIQDRGYEGIIVDIKLYKSGKGLVLDSEEDVNPDYRSSDGDYNLFISPDMAPALISQGRLVELVEEVSSSIKNLSDIRLVSLALEKYGAESIFMLSEEDAGEIAAILDEVVNYPDEYYI